MLSQPSATLLFRIRAHFCHQGVLTETPTEGTTTGSPGVADTAAEPPGKDETAAGDIGVDSASAGKAVEGETGPDGDELQEIQRPRGERGSGRDEGGNGASTIE